MLSEVVEEAETWCPEGSVEVLGAGVPGLDGSAAIPRNCQGRKARDGRRAKECVAHHLAACASTYSEE